VVDIEHRRLASLEDHHLAPVEGLVEDEGRVGDHRPYALRMGEQFLDGLVDGGWRGGCTP